MQTITSKQSAVFSNRSQIIALMMLLLFISQAGTDIYLPALPQMAKEFHVTKSEMNLTISIYNYGQAFFVLVVGVISDLFGRRSVLIKGLFLHLAASFLIAFSNQLNLIIGLRLFQAFGSAVIYIVLRLIIKDTMEIKEQIRATGILVIGIVLSPALAPMIGAFGILLSLAGFLLMAVSLLAKNGLLILGLLTEGICVIRIATALINPPAQVLVANNFGKSASYALGLLTCLQYSFAGIGSEIVSNLPFGPSINLIINSLIFTIISVIGILINKYNKKPS